MSGKAKPQKHTAKEIAQKHHEAKMRAGGRGGGEAGKIGDNSPKISNKKYDRDEIPIKNNNYIEENNDNQNYEEENQQKEKRIPIHKRKPETKDMIMRKKLHQLEQSPPPMLNIKGVKSKIECWGPSNETKVQKNTKNTIEKNNKK